MKVLTVPQRQALKLAGFAGAPISLADFPAYMQMGSIKALAERGLLAVTVQMTPAGQALLEDIHTAECRRKQQAEMNKRAKKKNVDNATIASAVDKQRRMVPVD